MNKTFILKTKRKGITLIELLVAISLLTLIIMAGSGIYLSGWNMFRQAQVMAQAQRNAMIPMAHMAKNLQDAISFDPDDINGLTFTSYSNITATPPTTVTGRYTFNNTTHIIQFDSNIGDAIAAITIGSNIHTFAYTINSNEIIVPITIGAKNNQYEGDDYTVTSIITARCGATPPV